MSEPTTGGTTAIQVSPTAISDLVHFAEGMLQALQALQATQQELNDKSRQLLTLQDQYNLEVSDHNVTKSDRDDLRNRLSLLETENAGTQAELQRTITNLNHANSEIDRRDARIHYLESCLQTAQDGLTTAKRERDDALFSNLEVSEALASANAKLNKFRELLGVGLGQNGPTVVDPRPSTPQAPEQAPVPEVVLPSAPSAFASALPLESNPSTDSGIGTGGYLQGDRVEDHQNEMPVKDERAAEGPSAFPSPAPIVEGSPKPEAASEHGSSGLKADYFDPKFHDDSFKS